MRELSYDQYDEDDFDDAVLYKPDGGEIHGRFTNGRIDKGTLPEGTYAYDMRESEDGPGTIEAETVNVNFGGTFVCEEPIDFGGEDCIDIEDENSPWGFSFE